MINSNENRNLGSNYSKIISPEDYNRLMSCEHLYIHISDTYIANIIRDKTEGMALPNVIEVGCGPGRILPLISEKNPHIRLFGIDLDQDFIAYARSKTASKNVTIIESSALNYHHESPVDIFYSQGFHHHIGKGSSVRKYLENIYNQLKLNGYYILGDEFITEYNNEKERQVSLVLWYCHIIHHASKNGFDYLAQEEAKTMLDDIHEGEENDKFKKQEQIDFILNKCGYIDELSRKDNKKSRLYSCDFLDDLKKLSGFNSQGDDRIDLSRGDYKVCDSVFRAEVENVGFKVEKCRSFGPLETVGAMVVYVLKK